MALVALLGLLFVARGSRGDDPSGRPVNPTARASDPVATDLSGGRADELLRVADRVEAIASTPETAPGAASAASDGAELESATLAVRVVDEEGRALADAAVVARYVLEDPSEAAVERDAPVAPARGSTDREGRVVLDVRAGRRLELRASHEGLPGKDETFVAPLAAGARGFATVVFASGADHRIHGRVVDDETGAPLPGIEVRIDDRGNLGELWRKAEGILPPKFPPDAVTDSAGRFRLRLWRRTTPRTWLALFNGPGHGPRLVRVHRAADPGLATAPGGEAAPLEIALRRAARIEGTVQGAPAPTRVSVAVSGPDLDTADRSIEWMVRAPEFVVSAAVEESGAFMLDGLPAETNLTLSLVSAETGELLQRESKPIRIASGATHVVDWVFGASGRLECSVHDAAGAPAPNEELWLLPATHEPVRETQRNWEPLQRARTDQRGRATFENVRIGRWLVALAPFSSGAGAAAVRYGVNATIDAPGANVSVAFTLHAALFISGTVLGPDGSPAQTLVTALKGSFHSSARSDAKDGRFRIGPLLPGSYRLRASASGSRVEGGAPLAHSDAVTAVAGAEGVELRLNIGALISVTAVDAGTGDRVPSSFALMAADSEDSTRVMAYVPKVTLDSTRTGRHSISARSADGRVGVVALDVTAGERHEVTVPLAAGGTILVTNSDPVRTWIAVLESPGELEDTRTKVAPVWVGPDGTEALVAPVGSYTLRSGAVDFDLEWGEQKISWREPRTVTLTEGCKLAIDCGP